MEYGNSAPSEDPVIDTTHDGPAVVPPAAGPAIEVADLRRSYGDFEAVRGIDFEVAVGETFGFLGPNGAGKSTTISMLCTLLTPSGGTARVAGHDVVADRLRVRRAIGLVFQDSTLDTYLTADENLRFHAQLYGMPGGVARERIRDVLDMVGLWERRDQQVRMFSGGMKRRLEIARGLLHSPRVLFLDEPTIGLDPQTRKHIWDYIERLRQREDVTIFLTTHYMDEAELCHRIAIIDHGRIVALDTPDALKAQVGQDHVELRTVDDGAAVRQLRERLGVTAKQHPEGLTFYVAAGEEFVPRLFHELDVRIDAVSVARPTLDDVFMTHTGVTIRDAEASSTDRARENPFLKGSRG
jgi:ABC-2 type transport system ATP-binding protein